jgi:hypothetical protein
MLATICGGGTGDQVDILVRIDAAGSQPIADPQIMRAAGKALWPWDLLAAGLFLAMTPFILAALMSALAAI